MKLKNILNPSVISTNLKSSDKEGVIKELLAILISAKLIPSEQKELVFNDLMEREHKMSTGIQHGVAIPHAKTKVVKSLVVCIGVKEDGVDFASLDGEPSTIFIMTLSPTDRVGPHVQFLAEVSMVIKEESARKAILEARTAKDVLAVFGI